MHIDAKMVKELRDISGGGVLDCRKALEDAGGSMEEALRLLRERGLKVAAKKADRAANEGSVIAYIHGGGRIGVLVEMNCETDFVARTEEFQGFGKRVAMQIAALDPVAVSREDIPPATVESEREVYRAQLRETGKPAGVIDKIVEGKLEKYFEEACLLDQEWVHDPAMGKVSDVLKSVIAKLGENIVIRRFARFKIGT